MPENRVFLYKDTPIHYWPVGEGMPVLCVHGYSVDHRILTGCMEPVFKTCPGFQRIYVDLPGMGKTPAAPWLMGADEMLEALLGFIQGVIGEAPFLLMGQSYGGYLSLGIAHRLKAQAAGLLLLCPAIIARHAHRIVPQKGICRRETLSAPPLDEAIYQNYEAMAVIISDETWNAYCRDVVPGLQAGNAQFLARFQGEGYAFSFEDALSSLDFPGPVTVLTGRQDHVVGFSDQLKVLGHLPHLTYAVVDGAGHCLQYEKASLFQAYLLDFLQNAQR